MPAINTYAVTQVQIYQEYAISAIAGAASAAQLLNLLTDPATGNIRQGQVILVEAEGDDIVFNFGGSGVAASKTYTSNALPAGNFTVVNGRLMIIDINGINQSYVSVIAKGGGGTAYVRLASVRL